VLSLT